MKGVGRQRGRRRKKWLRGEKEDKGVRHHECGFLYDPNFLVVLVLSASDQNQAPTSGDGLAGLYPAR